MALAARQETQCDARVLVVDDSSSVRATMLSLLKEFLPEKQISFAVDGRHALQQASRAALSDTPFDLVLLDIEMPLMDGLQALDELTKLRPAPKVIMSSALTRRGAAASMQALSRGACDYICKPTSAAAACMEEFRGELVQKVLFWASGETVAISSVASRPATTPPVNLPIERPSASRKPERERPKKPPVTSVAAIPKTKALHATDRPVSVTKARVASPAPPARQPAEIPVGLVKRPSAKSRLACSALAIGSSTGGPQALLNIFGSGLQHFKYPIFITQHMPPTFTTILAEQIAKASGIVCQEATDGEPVEPGRIYLAPGTHHMVVKRQGSQSTICLSDAQPVNFCRPAVDPMLESLASAYGGGLRVIILTGMGQDGLLGCQEAQRQGAKIFAQDEDSSVVWGMPGAVCKAGVAEQILPLQDFAGLIRTL